MDGKIRHRIVAYHVDRRVAEVEFDDPFVGEQTTHGLVLVSRGDVTADGKPIFERLRQPSERRAFERRSFPVEFDDEGRPRPDALRDAIAAEARHLYGQFEARAKVISEPLSVALAIGLGAAGETDVSGEGLADVEPAVPAEVSQHEPDE